MTSSTGETKGSTEYKYTTGGVTVWGYYGDVSSSLITMVNQLRAANPSYDSDGNVLATVNVSNTLASTAKSRVLELTQNYSHSGADTDNEVIGYGFSSYSEAMSTWANSSTHASTIVNRDFTNAGAACFWYDSDNNGTMVSYWVIVFNY